jgi:hypothetical protein
MLHCGRQQRIKCARLSTTKSQQIVGCRDIDFLLHESTRYAELSKSADSTALLVCCMSERQESPYDSTARRWLALVERRQQNFIELWNTGRWPALLHACAVSRRNAQDAGSPQSLGFTGMAASDRANSYSAP